MKPKITVMGSLNMDLVVQVKYFPSPGQTVMGSNLDYIPGGKGANQAVASARLGADVAMIGKVGSDTFGQILIENLVHNDINTKGVGRERLSSGTALICVSDTGENQIVVSPGSNALVNAQFVHEQKDFIEDADVLLVQLETPLEAVHKSVDIAHEKGILVILNPAPAQKLPEELLSQVDILTPNETELAILSDLPVTKIDEVKVACKALLNIGVKCIITTMGHQGALVCTKEQAIHIPGYKIQNVVDTTAAGDSFSGALAVALGQKKSLEEAIDFANKVGALTVTKRGAQTSLPYLEDVHKFTVEGRK